MLVRSRGFGYLGLLCGIDGVVQGNQPTHTAPVLLMLRFAERFPRLFASLWFAVAGLMVPLWLTLTGHFRSADRWLLGLIWYGALPALTAACAGALIGTPILRAAQTMAPWQAMGRGVSVGLLALSCHVPIFVVGYMVSEHVGIASMVAIATFVAFGAAFFAGIPIVLIGGAAGWLLHRVGLRVHRRGV